MRAEARPPGREVEVLSPQDNESPDKPGYNSSAMSWEFWRHDRAPRLEVHDDWYGYRHAAIRTTPDGHTHVRITAYCVPCGTMVASVPFSSRQGMFVLIDDENCWRYLLTTQVPGNPSNYGGENLFSYAPFPAPFSNPAGITPRKYTAENEYLIDREEQPPALATPGHGFRGIRGAEKIPGPGEDRRILGTDGDPVVQEARMALQASTPLSLPDRHARTVGSASRPVPVRYPDSGGIS